LLENPKSEGVLTLLWRTAPDPRLISSPRQKQLIRNTFWNPAPFSTHQAETVVWRASYTALLILYQPLPGKND
jgi:hypothetical protein